MAANMMTVQCDANGCKWSKPEHADNMKVWHNAACPACGHSPVVSDADMEILAGLKALRDMGLAKIGTGEKLDVPAIDIRVNTRSLRRGAAPGQGEKNG